MKTATLPPVRIEPTLKRELEKLLEPGESISSFVQRSVAKSIAVRKAQKAFVARALEGEREADRTRGYIPADRVFRKMETVLARARRKQARAGEK